MIEKKSLTPKQERFALGITQGLNLTDAYRRAFAVRQTTKAETVWSSASRLLADLKVSARVSELRERVMSSAWHQGSARVTVVSMITKSAIFRHKIRSMR